MASTFGFIRRTARSWDVPKTFFIAQVIMSSCCFASRHAPGTPPVSHMRWPSRSLRSGKGDCPFAEPMPAEPAQFASASNLVAPVFRRNSVGVRFAVCGHDRRRADVKLKKNAAGAQDIGRVGN